MIIPSIDIMNGKAVQLVQGKDKVLERDDIFALADKFNRYGEVAIIDLDAALGKGDNLQIIKKLCSQIDCRVGGGIRSIEKANELLAAGAKKIIIGTKANQEFLSKLPKNRLLVALDTKNGKVVTEGWRKTTNSNPFDMISELNEYCSGYLFTDVDREGLKQGINKKLILELKKYTDQEITIAGGIKSSDEIEFLEENDFNSQVGMAIYTGTIDLTDTFIQLLNFEKNQGFIPTIVQDENDQILMLVRSSQRSLKISFDSGFATYFSKTRNEIWPKGSTSGNTQELIKIRYDCDRDTLLFTVKQKNVACHTGSYTCFGEKKFNLQLLYDVIYDRISNPNSQSYTTKISSNESILLKKIKEEANEVVEYKNKDNLIWEIADLTYFVLTLMVKNKISIKDITNELWRRRS